MDSWLNNSILYTLFFLILYCDYEKVCPCTYEICSEVLKIKEGRWFRHTYTCTEQETDRDREIIKDQIWQNVNNCLI